MLIGRNEEVAELNSIYKSPKSEFVAIYGRRRVGKTYLIQQVFREKFAFQHTGILDATLDEQIEEFVVSLRQYGATIDEMPQNWHQAFHLLEQLLGSKPDGKKVVFIDEMPWMDTPRSNFIRALDHFWNGWAASRNDLVLIICGSATSWIIDKVIMNYGGLHNRLTRQIFLRPFTLKECEEICESYGLGYTRRQVLDGYMAMGGIPYYWGYLERGKSLAQNFDKLFFSEYGALKNEFTALYNSLFRHPEAHIAIITALASKTSGMLREEILSQTGLSDNTTFSNTLSELQQCGFIRKYHCLGKNSKDAIYQLIDNYTLFYFKFIQANDTHDRNFWSTHQNTPLYNIWAGLAFERVCLQHIDQIKAALGFAAVASSEYSWVYRPTDASERGVQIDLLIDRADQVINLCEMKYSGSEYLISKEEDAKMRNRLATFQRESKAKKAVYLTMITTYGLVQNGYANDVPCQLTMDALFDGRYL